MKQTGLYEELMLLNKSYPEAKRVYPPLHPQAYKSALLNQIVREIGTRLADLASSGDHQGLIQFVEALREQLRAAAPPLQTPLQAVHYSPDRGLPPLYPQLFLSTAALITNQSVDAFNFLKTLKFELLTADRADFMVSFVRWSGLHLLLQALGEMTAHAKPIRILTSTYLNVTEPKALRRLLEMKGVEVRLYDSRQESFHTKAYLFARDSELDTVIIGSSNLTCAAVKSGYEWNVKLPNQGQFPIYQKARQLFDQMWSDPQAIPLTGALVDAYQQHYEAAQAPPAAQARRGVFTVGDFQAQVAASVQAPADPALLERMVVVRNPVAPNAMQEEALQALIQTRANGYSKGVIIAATGTGKTYLSALDVQQFGAQRLLFIAHRDELLEKAKDTFSHVFGNAALCGKLTGTEKEWDKPFLFSTVQTLHREGNLERFAADHFDYIVVDEFHHADAATYRKVLDHFEPKFLLGLTATPERMDGGDILELCDNNVIHEIRLREALQAELLAPFHFFGLHDPTVDYDQIPERGGLLDDVVLTQALKTSERVDHVIKMIHQFGYDGQQMVALGFCATIEHAQFMADEFNARGWCAGCLTGLDAPGVRQAMVARLEDPNDPLQVIFTVNIFNEGVDIPSLNLLLFLRPTESATVFMQQLGRGLRKTATKEYVTVLDFIGNYRKSFVVPLALSGQANHLSFDRDALRTAVEMEFSDLPAGCFVDLHEVPRQQILEKIDKVRMDTRQMLIDLYAQFKRHLGRPPELEDFLYSEEAPSLAFFIRKFKSWVQTKEQMQDLSQFDQRLLRSPVHLTLTQRLEQMLPIKWPYELVILHLAVQGQPVTTDDVLHELKRRYSVSADLSGHRTIVERAMRRLSEAPNKGGLIFGEYADGRFTLAAALREAWQQALVTGYLQRRLEYGLTEFRRSYRPEVFFAEQHGVIPYQNYTRSELKFLFQDPTAASWREGVSRVGNHYLLFVNLRKDEEVANHLQYHDYFIDQDHFHWQSQNQTAHRSERGKDYVQHQERGLHIHLFVRKFIEMHGVTLPFTYLGEVDYVSSHDDQPMNVTWRLHQPVPDDLFADFIH